MFVLRISMLPDEKEEEKLLHFRCEGHMCAHIDQKLHAVNVIAAINQRNRRHKFKLTTT